jgi:hypothetical protein
MFVYYENQGPFVKLVTFDETLAQLWKSFVKVKTQNQRIQWFNLNFSTTMLIIKHNLQWLTSH